MSLSERKRWRFATDWRLNTRRPAKPDMATTLNNLNLGTVLGDLGSGKWRG